MGPDTLEQIKKIHREDAEYAAQRVIELLIEKGYPVMVPKAEQKIDPYKLIVNVCNYIVGEITKRK